MKNAESMGHICIGSLYMVLFGFSVAVAHARPSDKITSELILGALVCEHILENRVVCVFVCFFIILLYFFYFFFCNLLSVQHKAQTVFVSNRKMHTFYKAFNNKHSTERYRWLNEIFIGVSTYFWGEIVVHWN